MTIITKTTLDNLNRIVARNNKLEWNEALKTFHSIDLQTAVEYSQRSKKYSHEDFEDFNRSILKQQRGWKDLAQDCTAFAEEYFTISQMLLNEPLSKVNDEGNFALFFGNPKPSREILIKVLQMHSRLLVKYADYFKNYGSTREFLEAAYSKVT